MTQRETKRDAHAAEKEEMRVEYQAVYGVCRQMLVRTEVKSEGWSDRNRGST